MPVFVLYPILIVIFGLNRWPLVGIGFLFAVVAMAVNTLNGLERVPRVMLRTARVCRMSAFDEIRLITLPASLPFVFTGIKLTVVYAFIAVVVKRSNSRNCGDTSCEHVTKTPGQVCWTMALARRSCAGFR